MSQNPVQTTLFVSQVKAGPGMKVTPANGTGVVTIESDGETGQFAVNTPIATVGAGVLTAAAIVGTLITRSGSTAAFTDTTDTAVAIVAAIGASAKVGQSFWMIINNTTAFPETLAAGVGVTLSGFGIIPGNSTGMFLVTLTSLTAVSIQGVDINNNISVPNAKFTTQNLTAGVTPAANMAGAAICYLSNINATPGNQTTPTAAALLAAIPGAQVGFSYTVRVINTGAGTWTWVADASVTLTGTATVLTNITRDYLITFLTATTASMQSVGSGVSP